MADRYPIHANGFVNQQQSHLPQQATEGHVAGFPDQGPMWQQMQQMQNQFRPQSTGLDASHINPQVADMMRNQRQGQQQFPPFLDQQSNSFQPPIQTLNGRFPQANNTDTHRQLELLGLAHNQQPQNGPVNFANRMHQQAALNGQRIGQPETFLAAPGPNPMRQPSPSGGQPSAPPPTGQPAQVTRASYVALQERAHNLKSIISNQEAQLMQLTSQRTRIGDASFMDKVRTVSADLKNRKEHYARLVNFINQIQSHIQHGGNMAINSNAPMSLSQQPNSWISGSQPAQPPFNPNQGPQPSQNNGLAASPPNTHLHGPPRPQQFSNPLQPSPSFPIVQPPFANIPPLEKARFENVFKSWCNTRNIQLNPRILTIDARSIDLHDLHTQVMLEGGAQVVGQKDLWTVVGGRMGFIQFPASDSEPAKSGPGVAQQLAHAYKEYLAAFDNVYLSTVIDQRRKNNANLQQSLGPPRLSDPAQMQLVMQSANLPTTELRRRGFPEQVVQFVENNRTTLLQNRLDQAKFHDLLAPTGNGQQPPIASNPGNLQPGSRPPPQPPRAVDPSSQPPQRPTRESVQAAMVQLAKLKSEYGPERMLSNVPPIDIPPEQRMEYNTVLEQLHRACVELDHKLPMILAVLKNESVVRRYVIIVQTAIQQRAMITSGSTRFLVTLETLRNMLNQVQGITENFATILSSLMGKQQVQIARPVVPNPPVAVQSGGPPQPPVNRPPINLQPPPNSKRRLTAQSPAPVTPAAPTPTPPPVASASTPVHNAPTPRDMASPKSPKPKSTQKSKPQPARRKQSIKVQNPPIQEAVTAPSPAGSNSSSNKRPRDEESSPSLHNVIGPNIANEPSPPKRAKTEWDGPLNEAITARAEQVDNVKTEEDSTAFLEQMTELFRMANDGQDRLTSDFSDTLDTILKGFGTSTDETTLPSLGLSDSTVVAPTTDESFVEFFDFSSFSTGEEDDVAPTPELISSSVNPSTNPSPESNADMDASQVLLNFDNKVEEFDHLRLGVWKEVDGGESAHYNSGHWKWDSPMQHLEQPWAIHNS